MLRVRDLTLAYGEADVLRRVSLDVPAGELLCVLGPSGSGKSTLLRAIAGLEIPRHGSIELGGRDLAGVPPHERGVGLMFQDYALFPHRDVGENIAFGPRMRGEGSAAVRAHVAELLDLVGLPGAERRAVAQLSGGEQQRVALARALAPRPQLLMLDEPLGSLDRALRERLPEELRAIFAELGLTVIYVTHDQDEALSVADRVVLLDAGRIRADGSPEELWTRPPNEWSARFLGFRNIGPGRLDTDRLSTPWGELPAAAADIAATIPVRAGADAAPAADSHADGGGAPVTVVLRPVGLVVDPAGPILGRVAGRRFRGDHVLLRVELPDAPPLYVEARDGDLPALNDVIRLAVRPGGAHVIPEAPPEQPAAAPAVRALPSSHER